MNTGSLCALLGAMGCAAAFAACSSDSTPGTPAPVGTEAGTTGGASGTGGKGTGGTSTSSGGKSGGGTVGAGGASGGAGGAATGGASAGGTSNDVDAGSTDSGAGGVVGDGGLSCVFPRCRPKYLPVPFSTANPYSDDKALLGKILFWEEQVGQLDTMACGTCHRGAAGGSDPRTNQANAMLKGPNGVAETQPDPLSDDLRVAQGVPVCDITGNVTGSAPQTTARKPPTYLDAMFGSQIFWDGRAGYCANNEGPGGCFYDPDVGAPTTPVIVGVTDVASGFIVGGALEAQASGPPANSTEMACAGRTWAAIETKLATVTPLAKAQSSTVPPDMKAFIAANGNSYPKMFKAVYGSDAKYKVGTQPDDIINARRIVFAIATHERRLTSDQTPWDLWNDGAPAHDNALDADEIAGFTLFMGKARCSGCHPPPLFTDNAFHNIGFHKPTWDPGRETTTKAANGLDTAKFKTPTLRNVGLREPFGLLHDGDGPGHSLDTVMQLYNAGGKRSDSEILPLIDPSILALGLTTVEIAQITKFLRKGLTDPRVAAEAFPFDRPKLGTE